VEYIWEKKIKKIDSNKGDSKLLSENSIRESKLDDIYSTNTKPRIESQTPSTKKRKQLDHLEGEFKKIKRSTLDGE